MLNSSMDNLCTLYSSDKVETRILELINDLFKRPNIDIETADRHKIFRFTYKKGFFGSKTAFQISCRHREESKALIDDSSPLAQNLLGMKGFVSQIPPRSVQAIKSLNTSIDDIISETAIVGDKADSKQLLELVTSLAKEKDCIVYCQTRSFVGKTDHPHFLNKDLDLLLDVHGNSEAFFATGPMIEIEPQQESELLQDQIDRKKRNIEFIKNQGIKTIDHLPVVASEKEVKIRSVDEIAARAVIIAITNHVAFSNMTGEQAKELIATYKLEKYVTSDESAFLDNPTDDLKNKMSWKCEAIWVLCWALGIVKDLGTADSLADLNLISSDEYPIVSRVDPNTFITKKHKLRSARDILDQNDLYYRLNWACVNARLNGHELDKVHPGVVYERQYALNWLINYMNQDWDDITCDT